MQRFYPTALERGTKETFGMLVSHFPRYVAGGTSQEQAIARAREALAQAVSRAHSPLLPAVGFGHLAPRTVGMRSAKRAMRKAKA